MASQGPNPQATTYRGSVMSGTSTLDKPEDEGKSSNDHQDRDVDLEKQEQSQQKKSENDEDEEHDPDVVDWDGDDDPLNPMNWSPVRKWGIAVTMGLMTFVVTFASSVFSSATEVTAMEFGVSSEVMILAVSLFVLGFAFGPIVWGPLSELVRFPDLLYLVQMLITIAVWP